MIERSQNLSLVSEAFLNECGIKSAAHQLDCYFLCVLPVSADSAIHFAHPAVSNFLDDLIYADAPPGARGGRRHRRLQIHRRSLQKTGARLFMRRKKGGNFTAQLGIAVAYAVQKRRALGGVERNSFLQELLHLLPSFRVHAGASPVMARYNQARAVTQSRFTVAGEIPRTSEVSSMVSPAKKRSSTIRLCCASSSASPVKALSNSTTSTLSCCGRATASSRASRKAPPPRLAVLRPRAYSTRICRMIWAAIPKKCARFCHCGGFCPARRKYASCTSAVLCRV